MKRMLILGLVIFAIAGVIILKKAEKNSTPSAPAAIGMPRLLELGSEGCTACTLMEPVLDELRTKHPGTLQVDFVDVMQHEEAVDEYGIDLIPSQIFFDRDGKEFFRHQGFISVEEIESKFAELGVPLNAD